VSVLEQNQPAESEQDKQAQGSYQPDEKEQRAIKLVNELFEAAKKARKKYDDKWLDYYHYFRGKQWKGNRPTYKSSEVINLVWQHIQSIVPIITDSKPKFDFIGDEPSDTEFGEILSQMASSDWDKNGWLFKLSEILYDSHIYGIGLGEIGYDAEAYNQQGCPTFTSVDPFCFFPDPSAESLKEKGDHFITADPIRLKKAKREAPQHLREFIKADLIDMLKESKTDLDHPKLMSASDSGMVRDMETGNDSAAREMCLKITLYMRDYETEEIQEPYEEQQPVIDPMTGQPAVQVIQDPMTGEVIEQPLTQTVQLFRTITKLKYPNGRKIVLVGGVITSDGEYPFDDDGDFQPFARLVNYIDPRSFYGVSEVEQLVSPQNMFNKIISFMMDCWSLTGNPVWVVDDTSGVDEENLVNRQGLVITKAQGSEVRREPGIQINPDLFRLTDSVRLFFNDMAGSQDVSRGAKPEGITAASAIQSLQEAAQTRLRLKSRNLDDFLQQAGQKWRNRTMQFTTVPKAYRITNNQAVQKYFKFHVDQAEDGTKVAKVRDFVQNPETGQYSEALETREFVVKGYMDTKATTGSSLPFAKTEKANMAFQLFDRGAIDQEELLTAVDYPNKEKVLQRMQMKAEQAAQAQMMGGLTPAGGTGQAPPVTA
jgi:hypothetical protein